MDIPTTEVELEDIQNDDSIGNAKEGHGPENENGNENNERKEENKEENERKEDHRMEQPNPHLPEEEKVHEQSEKKNQVNQGHEARQIAPKVAGRADRHDFPRNNSVKRPDRQSKQDKQGKIVSGYS